MALSVDQIVALHQAIVSTGLSRESLIAGLSGSIVALLPVSGSPSEQILQDLHLLNAMADKVLDGSTPLDTYLRNAASLTVALDVSRVFKDARLSLSPPDASPDSLNCTPPDNRTTHLNPPLRQYPGHLTVPGGALPTNTQVYVEREADATLASFLDEGCGRVVLLRGAYQVGKSSMLARLAARFRAQSRKVAFVDLSSLGGLDYPDFIAAMFDTIAGDLTDLAKSRTPPPQRTHQLMARLRRLADNTLLIFDEVDCLRSTPYASDFFAMIRAIHNQSAMVSDYDIRQVMAITTNVAAIDPTDLYRSPFNVGIECRLQNFSAEEFHSLFYRMGTRLAHEHLTALYLITGGQPYLSHLSAFMIQRGAATSDIISHAHTAAGPFGTHLLQLYGIVERLDLLNALVAFIDGSSPLQERDLFRLIDVGILRITSKTEFACTAYEKYFAEVCVGAGRLTRQ